MDFYGNATIIRAVSVNYAQISTITCKCISTIIPYTNSI